MQVIKAIKLDSSDYVISEKGNKVLKSEIEKEIWMASIVVAEGKIIKNRYGSVDLSAN